MPYYGKVLSELLYLEVYVLRNQKNDNQKGPCKKYSDMKNSKSTKPVNLKIDTHLSLSNLNITLKFYENVLKLFACHRKCYCLLNIKNSKSNNSVIPKPIDLETERSLPLPHQSIVYKTYENLPRKTKVIVCYR